MQITIASVKIVLVAVRYVMDLIIMSVKLATKIFIFWIIFVIYNVHKDISGKISHLLVIYAAFNAINVIV